MVSFTVNADPSYKPVPFKTSYYQEMLGASVQSFLRAPEWAPDNTVEIFDNISVDTGKPSTLNTASVYRGTVKDRTVGLIVGFIKNPYRVFAVTSEEAYQKLLLELQTNNGYLDEQLKDVAKVKTGNDANAIYAWQGQFFGYGDISDIIRKSNVARKVGIQKGTRLEVLDGPKAAVDLVKQIAKRYDIYNVEVAFGKFGGGGNANTVGYCKVPDDETSYLSRPHGIFIWLAEDLLFKHTVVHEMSHAIEIFKTGVGGHGKGFRNIYKLLIRQYLNMQPEGL